MSDADNVIELRRPSVGRFDLMDGLTGEILDGAGLLDRTAPSSLALDIQLLERVKATQDYLRRLQCELEQRVIAATPGEKRTETLQANSLTVKVDHGGWSWAPDVLRRLWHDPEYQGVRDRYLSIASVRVKARKVYPLLDAVVAGDSAADCLLRQLQKLRQRAKPRVTLQRELGGDQ